MRLISSSSSDLLEMRDSALSTCSSKSAVSSRSFLRSASAVFRSSVISSTRLRSVSFCSMRTSRMSSPSLCRSKVPLRSSAFFLPSCAIRVLNCSLSSSIALTRLAEEFAESLRTLNSCMVVGRSTPLDRASAKAKRYCRASLSATTKASRHFLAVASCPWRSSTPTMPFRRSSAAAAAFSASCAFTSNFSRACLATFSSSALPASRCAMSAAALA
mmetsp:Transcript_144885/g.252669  ORF Transcript_144885/g.252669 Transcript_144885/m.252669 type:complete len:216 (-) Transcript_144885:406-1053(-)